MLRRLYFLLPNAKQTKKLISELKTEAVDSQCMHTIAGRGIDDPELPQASQQQSEDLGEKIENNWWLGNLILFFIALSLFVVFIMADVDGVAYLLLAGVMLITVATGNYFVTNIPHVHIAEFKDALKHKEILLMVDVPSSRVAEIEQRVHHTHPEALPGGVGWTIGALHT